MSTILNTLFLSLAICSIAFGQNTCNCKTELDFVVDYYEKNLPGFKDNVTPDNKASYEAMKQTLATTATATSNTSDCFKLLTYYVEFFKDNHSSIYFNSSNVNEQNEEELNAFLASDIYQSRETYNINKEEIKTYPLDDIRGIYQTQDSSYTIAIVPNKAALRDYIGVIVDSKTKLWKKGQVKMELKSKADGNFEAFVYMRNHSLRFYPNFMLKDGILGDSWFKSQKKDKINYSMIASRDFEFHVISDSITYISIPTFSGDFSAKIDSFYKKIKPTLETTPYLIIDVRNNGGGSDDNANPLLDYIYTNPISGDNVDLYATPDNLKMWEAWTEEAKADPTNYSKQDVRWFKRQVKQMKRAKPYTFVPRSKGQMLKRKVNPERPQKVIILQNKYCASSCETLLFWAKESKNTILVGENSGGYVGYGEVGNINTPCYDYNLTCTMTRYEKQRAYEVVGVSPDYYLSNEKNWIEQAIPLFDKENLFQQKKLAK